MVAPLCVRPRGIAGGFRRFVGVGGGGLRRGCVCVCIDVSSVKGGEGGVATTAGANRVCGDNGDNGEGGRELCRATWTSSTGVVLVLCRRLEAGAVMIFGELGETKAGRLWMLALLGRRVCIWSNGERGICLVDGSVRIESCSTLLLCFSDFIALFPVMSRCIGVGCPIGGLSIADVSLFGVLTRWMPYPALSLSSLTWRHQSPDRHLSTRRFVVGLTSRIFELPSNDSSVTRICGRL